jgi:integrator complex subunit 11
MHDLKAKVPVYFSAGMTERANEYYKLFISWTNEHIKKTFVEHNLFDFTNIKTWDGSLVDNPGPVVLFASPGMVCMLNTSFTLGHRCRSSANGARILKTW